MSTHLWLRSESKAGERRSPLEPGDAAKLCAAGVRLTVERSTERVFPDEDFVSVGAELADGGSWPEAPPEAIILGLKELPDDDPATLAHRHVYFGHAYKQQIGWRRLLSRFREGGGTLLDLESLVDDQGRRVAAFGHWAGYVGGALAVDGWARRRAGAQRYDAISPWGTGASMVAEVGARAAAASSSAPPRALVIGALGRTGRGAVAALEALGVRDIVRWDLEETRRGGPFPQALEVDIVINCVLIQGVVPPFITPELLARPHRLSIIVDVSCDPNGPFNPLPIYEKTTSFASPAQPVAGDVWLVAIDHLPSLLPRESSADFSAQLFPHLATLPDGAVWQRAAQIFADKSRDS